MKKVTVFIDGQNLWHSLRDIGLRESDIDWNKLINSFLVDGDELIRTYWFRPIKIQAIDLQLYAFSHRYIRKNYPDNKEEYCTQLRSKNLPDAIHKEIYSDYIKSKDWLAIEKQRFSQVDEKYMRIATAYDDLEIYRTGILKVDPFKRMLISEKGVDVALAVKMVEGALLNKYDKAILVSGDFDYQEAVQVVKNSGKKIHLVRFFKGHPPKDKFSSKQLASMADKVIDIYQDQLEGEFKITPKTSHLPGEYKS